MPPAWRLVVEESLPSTSDLLLRLAAAGEPEGLAVLAHRQTAGRGRDGRAWDSRAGNLHLSVLLRPEGPVREAPLWGLLAGVALAEALARFLPDPAALRLKWPNDVLLGGAKLAGLLCETAPTEDGRLDWLVIGLGANLALAPPVAGRPTACMADHAAPPQAEQAARAVLDSLGHWCDVFAARGFAPVRAAWIARGPDLGAPLWVRYATRQAQGLYAGLAEDGSLLLESGAVLHKFSTGETAAAGG